MRLIDRPTVFLVAYPALDWGEIRRYLKEVDPAALAWSERVAQSDLPEGEILVEFGGRLCYRSWVEGLNPNVSRVRTDSADYLGNIVSSYHGSVLEHANYSFVMHNVSRVFTHELVRHRAGAAYSQESMRFVRLDDLPFWFPMWARDDPDVMARSIDLLQHMERHQHWMADHFGLDDPAVPFSEKKAKTSFMRRFAPDGVATGVLATMNIRTLRHVIYMRTAFGAEEEIRLVFDEVARICIEKFPDLMADYSSTEYQEWIPSFIKV
jgi:thymidylate synthase (FAD)